MDKLVSFVVNLLYYLCNRRKKVIANTVTSKFSIVYVRIFKLKIYILRNCRQGASTEVTLFYKFIYTFLYIYIYKQSTLRICFVSRTVLFAKKNKCFVNIYINVYNIGL